MTSYVDPKVAAAVLDSADRYKTTRTTGQDVLYIGAADTARLIRSALKLSFPGVKFSVRSRNYSGASSVDVKWTDGPAKSKVDYALSGFVGKGFDGMIDLAYSSDCYMTRSGGIGFASSHGTAGSHGSVPSASGDVPFGAAIVVFMSYIFTDRDYSRAVTLTSGHDFWALSDMDL